MRPARAADTTRLRTSSIVFSLRRRFDTTSSRFPSSSRRWLRQSPTCSPHSGDLTNIDPVVPLEHARCSLSKAEDPLYVCAGKERVVKARPLETCPLQIRAAEIGAG